MANSAKKKTTKKATRKVAKRMARKPKTRAEKLSALKFSHESNEEMELLRQAFSKVDSLDATDPDRVVSLSMDQLPKIDFKEYLSPAKKVITISLDEDIVESAKEIAGTKGKYQSLLNNILRDVLIDQGKLADGLIREILSLKSENEFYKSLFEELISKKIGNEKAKRIEDSISNKIDEILSTFSIESLKKRGV